MNQQPDKLFQEKLQNFSKTVPANAWSRVEENLNKKNSKPLWLKIAAGFIMILSASVFLFIRNAPPAQLASQRNSTPDQVKKNNKTELPSKDTIQPLREKESTKAYVDRAKKNTSAKKKLRIIKDVTPVDVVVAQHVKKSEKENNRSQEIPVQVSEAVVVATQEVIHESEIKKQPGGVTIILGAEEVNEKYLDKKALAEATSDEKKSSTFKKLLVKANDLKHNQDAIGEIRQKKNEILALNFRNEKTRTQNR
jgi:hypothetical protein